MDLAQLRDFLGWCTLINSCLLILSGAAVLLCRERIISIHGRLFSMAKEDLSKAYFYYLAIYKILIICFNLTPYIALNFMLN